MTGVNPLVRSELSITGVAAKLLKAAVLALVSSMVAPFAPPLLGGGSSWPARNFGEAIKVGISRQGAGCGVFGRPYLIPYFRTCRYLYRRLESGFAGVPCWYSHGLVRIPKHRLLPCAVILAGIRCSSSARWLDLRLPGVWPVRRKDHIIKIGQALGPVENRSSRLGYWRQIRSGSAERPEDAWSIMANQSAWSADHIARSGDRLPQGWGWCQTVQPAWLPPIRKESPP